jgi:hypothetical protein
MENVANVFGSSRDSVTQINTSTNELARIAGELRDLVAWFKTGPVSGKVNKMHSVSNSQNKRVPSSEYPI